MATAPPDPAGPAAPDLTILETRVYRGPNLWSYEPAIHLVVDLGSPRGLPHQHPATGFTDQPAGAAARAWSGTPARAACRGGFVERLHEGTWLGHVAEHVALQLQQEAGHDLRRGKTRQVKGRRGVYNVVYAYSDERVGLAAGQLAVRLVNHLVQPEEGFDFAEELRRVPAAGRADGLRPVDRGDPRGGGQPRHPVDPPQRALPGPARPGRPRPAHPRHDDLEDRRARGRHRRRQGPHHQAARARPGCPVPRSESVRTVRGRGRGRRPDRLPGRRQAAGRQPRPRRVPGPRATPTPSAPPSTSPRASPGAAASWWSRFITGRDYRCLIVGGRMQAIAERVPAHVVGDGEHTVAELVDITNADPRRGVGHEKVLTRITRRRGRDGSGPLAGLLAGRRAAGRRDGQARADRQHVHGRHLGRPHLRRAPRQRRDRRGGGPDDRARRRGHRLHLPRHRLAGARDRRRHLRGQRRPRLPDAHPPHRRRAAVHRQAGRRPAVPPGRPVAGADRRGHRHQRQDHHRRG